jgi:hypothetical protein
MPQLLLIRENMGEELKPAVRCGLFKDPVWAGSDRLGEFDTRGVLQTFAADCVSDRSADKTVICLGRY